MKNAFLKTHARTPLTKGAQVKNSTQNQNQTCRKFKTTCRHRTQNYRRDHRPHSTNRAI